MKTMVESNNYSIMHEYEKVFLKKNQGSELVLIGEFYGDSNVAIISEDEKYCAIGGEGLIIYYLNEPFERYITGFNTSKQWKTWGRDSIEETIWITNLTQIDKEHIRIETEDFHTYYVSELGVLVHTIETFGG